MITKATPRSWVRFFINSNIWAWMVTSKAVVGSSAITIWGPQLSAMAIITRWRMPPLNWCGYWRARLGASGMPTSSKRRTASAFAAPLLKPR